ncbi:MAG TPA: hypothetical protein VI793_10670 [Anaerolineales bacterium]|nr:hypothetical protein [Anaerolineales bacterium]
MKLVGRRYQLLGILGAGGMGVVYLALDRLTAETVAFKRVSLPTYDDSIDPGLAAMMAGPAPVLAREFQALAALRHPNIITVRDYGFDVFEDSPDPPAFLHHGTAPRAAHPPGRRKGATL